MQSPARSLSLQSRLVVLAVVPAAAALVPVLAARAHSGGPVLAAFAVACLLALLTVAARAATGWAAATGALLTVCCALFPAGWRSGFWPLFAMLVLTLGSTRLARRPHRAENRGRTTAQVAANLGVAALAPALTDSYGQFAALTVMLAALAEAAADTVSSELGQFLGGTPRMLTTLKRVAPGTDGAVSPLGTLFGLLAAALVATVGVLVLHMPLRAGLTAAAAGAAGFFLDSLLGATLERPSLLENDMVNFLSTLAAAALALLASRR